MELNRDFMFIIKNLNTVIYNYILLLYSKWIKIN